MCVNIYAVHIIWVKLELGKQVQWFEKIGVAVVRNDFRFETGYVVFTLCLSIADIEAWLAPG